MLQSVLLTTKTSGGHSLSLFWFFVVIIIYKFEDMQWFCPSRFVFFLKVDNNPSNELVSSLIDAKHSIDTKMRTSHLTLFKVKTTYWNTELSTQELNVTFACLCCTIWYMFQSAVGSLNVHKNFSHQVFDKRQCLQYGLKYVVILSSSQLVSLLGSWLCLHYSVALYL